MIKALFKVREMKLSILWKGLASGAATPRAERTLKLRGDGFSSFLADDQVVLYNQRPSPFNCSKDGEWQEGERREKIFQNWQSPALRSAVGVGVQREKLCVGEGREGESVCILSRWQV